MAPNFQAPRGTHDVLPGEHLWWHVVRAMEQQALEYGWHRVQTPGFEDTALFARTAGEGSDVVNKEMYTFADRKGRSLTLRPENTAGVVRAIIENGLAAGPMPLRLWYAGPQFRYERPQAGRYREFRQIGAELLGVAGPAAEVEILMMLFAFLKALGFQALSVALNSVGTARSREAFGEALRAYLEPRAADFGEDDRRKLSENPLRLFDSRDPAVRAALEGSPRTLEYLDDASRRHHDEVRRLLTRASIPFRDDPSLVRGLDYYTRTVFEVVSADLGAQDAILGGGRYDNLVETLGGPALPAIGFAIGEDRLVQAAPRPAPEGGLLLVLPQGPEDLEEALRLADELRAALPVPVEVDLLARGFKKGMARGNALFEEASARGLDGARIFAVLLGEREREAGSVTVKRLASADQESVPRAEVVAWLKSRA